MMEKLNKGFEYIKRNILLTVLISVLFTFCAPLLFTIKLDVPFFDFTNTGQIGDTIGGITAPFINILNAILIYIAFTEQLKANNLLQGQIDIEKNKEIIRLARIKKLIFFDLEFNISPLLNEIRLEMEKYLLRDKQSQNFNQVNQFMEFNDEIYKTIAHTDLLEIFGNDFKTISQIYTRVKFISDKTPYNLSRTYPTSKTNLALANLEDKQYVSIRDVNNQKIDLLLRGTLDRPVVKCEELIKKILALKN